MSFETEIERAIENAITNLTITARLDCDNDLEITLVHNSVEISHTYVCLSDEFVKKDA